MGTPKRMTPLKWGILGGQKKRVPGSFFENFAVFEEIGGGLHSKLTPGSEQNPPPKVHFWAPRALL